MDASVVVVVNVVHDRQVRIGKRLKLVTAQALLLQQRMERLDVCDFVRCLRRNVLVLDLELGTGVVEVRTDELGTVVGTHDHRRLARSELAFRQRSL